MSTVVGPKRKSTPNQGERRKDRRQIVFTRYPVLIYTSEMEASGSQPLKGILTDIGIKGLGLITDQHIPKNRKLTLVLSADTDAEHKLVTTSVWSGPLPTSGLIIKPGNHDGTNPTEYWRVGLTLQADEEQKQFILDLIRKL